MPSFRLPSPRCVSRFWSVWSAPFKRSADPLDHSPSPCFRLLSARPPQGAVCLLKGLETGEAVGVEVGQFCGDAGELARASAHGSHRRAQVGEHATGDTTEHGGTKKDWFLPFRQIEPLSRWCQPTSGRPDRFERRRRWRRWRQFRFRWHASGSAAGEGRIRCR
jgi:hypothetical protein